MEEQTTTTQAQEITTTTTETQVQNITLNLSSGSNEALPDNSENIIHQLFAELGCDLDYTPTSGYQCFAMGLQFAAALWFIYWFVKMLWGLMRDFFKW